MPVWTIAKRSSCLKMKDMKERQAVLSDPGPSRDQRAGQSWRQVKHEKQETRGIIISIHHSQLCVSYIALLFWLQLGIQSLVMHCKKGPINTDKRVRCGLSCWLYFLRIYEQVNAQKIQNFSLNVTRITRKQSQYLDDCCNTQARAEGEIMH